MARSPSSGFPYRTETSAALLKEMLNNVRAFRHSVTSGLAVHHFRPSIHRSNSGTSILIPLFLIVVNFWTDVYVLLTNSPVVCTIIAFSGVERMLSAPSFLPFRRSILVFYQYLSPVVLSSCLCSLKSWTTRSVLVSHNHSVLTPTAHTNDGIFFNSSSLLHRAHGFHCATKKTPKGKIQMPLVEVTTRRGEVRRCRRWQVPRTFRCWTIVQHLNSVIHHRPWIHLIGKHSSWPLGASTEPQCIPLGMTAAARSEVGSRVANRLTVAEYMT